jgi:hypothetical protein
MRKPPMLGGLSHWNAVDTAGIGRSLPEADDRPGHPLRRRRPTLRLHPVPRDSQQCPVESALGSVQGDAATAQGDEVGHSRTPERPTTSPSTVTAPNNVALNRDPAALETARSRSTANGVRTNPPWDQSRATLPQPRATKLGTPRRENAQQRRPQPRPAPTTSPSTTQPRSAPANAQAARATKRNRQ